MSTRPRSKKTSKPGNKTAQKRARLEKKILELGRAMRPIEIRLRRAETALKDLQLACRHPNAVFHGAVTNCPDCGFRTMSA